jgi:hypothetical protein
MDTSKNGIFVPLTPDQRTWLDATAAEMHMSVEALLAAAIGLFYRMDNNGPAAGFLAECTERMERTAADVDETIAYIAASNKRIDAMLASSPLPSP